MLISTLAINTINIFVMQRSDAVSGATVLSDGSRVIPASKRADGSVREQKKIREGYYAPEDVQKYSNPHGNSTIKSMDFYKLPEPSTQKTSNSGANEPAPSLSKSALKRARRKQKKEASMAEAEFIENFEQKYKELKKQLKHDLKSIKDAEKIQRKEARQLKKSARHSSSSSSSSSSDSDSKKKSSKKDIERLTRGIEKRIRQCIELQEKYDQGVTLEPDQIAKLGRLPQLRAELAELQQNSSNITLT